VNSGPCRPISGWGHRGHGSGKYSKMQAWIK